MLKKTMTYETYDNEMITEDFYFNLSKAEIAELELSAKGGFGGELKKIIASEDGEQIIATFKKIILMAVGKKSEDGKRFIKSQELRDEFSQTEAYSDLFVELCLSVDAGADFINAIIPKGWSEDIPSTPTVELPAGDPGQGEVPLPVWVRENRDPTPKELTQMSPEELQEAFRLKHDRLTGEVNAKLAGNR